MKEHRERLARRAARAAYKKPEQVTVVPVVGAGEPALEVATTVDQEAEPATQELGWVTADELAAPANRRQPSRQSRSQRKK